MALLLVNIVILLQFISITIGKTVESSCPTTSASISRTPLSSTKQSSESLDSSCFELNITVNVENLLPDPTYILPEDNINAISDGIMRTLDDCDITIHSNETDNTWIIDNKCDQYESPHTVQNRQFATTQYNTSCDDDTLIINDTTGTITCHVTFPESMVYIWHLKQINLYIDIDFCSEIVMEAKIYSQPTQIIISVSEPVSIAETDVDKQYEFIFDATNNTLRQNTTYYVKFEMKQVLGKYNTLNDKFEYENVQCDKIITISRPSSCYLGKNVAVTKEIMFGLDSLCNESLARPEEELFESILFQRHSSQKHVPKSIWDSLVASTRNLLEDDGDSGGIDGEWDNSCVATYADGRRQTIADHDIFPTLHQCVAFDADTKRFFSVGGNDSNGNALDRLAVYYLETQSSLIPLDYMYPNLKLDKPRAITSCYYYKRNDDEYIIAINGMNHTKYANDSDYWYNDLVFIPLPDNTKDCDFPIVKLKFNVVDMKPFVTQNDILYLIGGRNGQNATNVIQIIDLDQVFDDSDTTKNKKKSHDVSTLTTYERMAPMKLNRVLPMTDFSYIVDQTCMVTWKGQNYMNQKWVNINDSMTQLEMYCNKLLIGYYDNTNSPDMQYTDYDYNNLVSAIQDDNSQDMSNKDSTSMHYYDFQNDGLWYKFWTQFQICFDDKDELQNKVNFFADIDLYNREILEENILIESQKNYRDWSYGFGVVDVVNINITEPTPCPDKNGKAMVPPTLDVDNKYVMTSLDGHNMKINIIALVLCGIFLVWICLTCCWTKYWNARKYKLDKM